MLSRIARVIVLLSAVAACGAARPPPPKHSLPPPPITTEVATLNAQVAILNAQVAILNATVAAQGVLMSAALANIAALQSSVVALQAQQAEDTSSIRSIESSDRLLAQLPAELASLRSSEDNKISHLQSSEAGQLNDMRGSENSLYMEIRDLQSTENYKISHLQSSENDKITSLQSSENNKIAGLQSTENNKIAGLQSTENNKIAGLQSTENNKISSLQSRENNLANNINTLQSSENGLATTLASAVLPATELLVWSGVRQNVLLLDLAVAGWTLYSSLPYSFADTTGFIIGLCAGFQQMLFGASTSTGATQLVVAAYANVSQILTQTAHQSGVPGVTNLYNGAYWYFAPGYSIGFTPNIWAYETPCDNTGDATEPYRLSWELDRGTGGCYTGAATYAAASWQKVVYCK